MVTRVQFRITNFGQVKSDLRKLEGKLRLKVMREGMTGAVRILRGNLRLELRKTSVTGATARSVISKISTRRKSEIVIGRVGQNRTLVIKNPQVSGGTGRLTLKGKNLSQIQRGGKAAPIHWAERGLKQRTTKPKKKTWLRFPGSGFAAGEAAQAQIDKLSSRKTIGARTQAKIDALKSSTQKSGSGRLVFRKKTTAPAKAGSRPLEKVGAASAAQVENFFFNKFAQATTGV